MGKELNKIKLLFLHDIFTRQTDKEHVYSANELCDLLSEYGINCERKSIYSDIEALKEYGMDIVNVRSPKRGYYLNERKFDVAEVRLLIDAVQAAKFISSKKTKALIYKIGNLLSEFQEEELREQIYVESTFKSEKEDLYEIIKSLDDAIKKAKQVQITYAKRKLENRYLKKSEGKVFIINPYSLLWSNDHYYLVCNNDKYNNLMHLRLDRISQVKLLDSPSKHFSKVSKYTDKFDTADYSNKIFNMFTGESGEIELCCDNRIIDDILEKFGDETPLKIFDENHFVFKADVELSSGLISWIMQYGADIKVLSPKNLSDALIEKTKEILSVYE
ncbi:MAG: WYL domain-containing transcriptional regulator [Clostridia bacterium]|nr:WYL domain-containing transcriptional regulator [Clostridia bacterium]